MANTRATILLTGASGQLGRELAAALPALGDVVACDRATLDLADPAAIVRRVREVAPRVIVNAGAYTAVDRAEAERDAAFAVNGAAPGVLADEARRANALLIHYSTDYVFDGERTTPYDESAPVHPINVYGESASNEAAATQLAVERALAASGAAAITLRTSWVYGRHGQNFLVTMQKLAARQREVRVVADQSGVPNWTRALAEATTRLLAQGGERLTEHAGLYHMSAQGATTWYGFARAILEQNDDVSVTPITTADYPTPARRPRYGVLDASRFARVFGFAMRDWQALLRECLHSAAEPPRPREVR